jgi:hypothetical protein
LGLTQQDYLQWRRRRKKAAASAIAVTNPIGSDRNRVQHGGDGRNFWGRVAVPGHRKTLGIEGATNDRGTVSACRFGDGRFSGFLS